MNGFPPRWLVSTTLICSAVTMVALVVCPPFPLFVRLIAGSTLIYGVWQVLTKRRRTYTVYGYSPGSGVKLMYFSKEDRDEALLVDMSAYEEDDSIEWQITQEEMTDRQIRDLPEIEWPEWF